jgi:O-antigen/teichoic acid export membrane protein
VPAETLRDATIRGLRWLALTRVLGETLGFVCAVALARLVAPHEFGHAAVALIFLPLAGILTFEGFASALVQQEAIDEDDRGAAMAMSLAGGAILSLLVLALAGPVWWPLFGAGTASLIELISPILFIAAIGAVSRALLLRRLHFGRVSVIDLASVASGNAVAVGLAAAGFGARALVIGALSQIALGSGLLVVAARPPLPRLARHSQRRIAVFGLPAALGGLVEVLFRNVDYAILAARLSPAATGIYYRAFNLGVVYQDKISGVMVQVAYPVYSRTRDMHELRLLHERAARVHSVVIFPLLASLIVLAPVLIPFVFGDAWRASVGPAQVLALAGMLAAVLTGYAQVMLAIGRPRPLLYFNIVRLLVYGGAVALAARGGLMTVAVAVVLAYLAILLGAYRFLLQRYVGISLRRLIPELGPAALSSLALAAVTFPLCAVLRSALPRPLVIALVGTVGLVTYAIVLRVGFTAAWTDARLLILRVFPPLGRFARRAVTEPETSRLVPPPTPAA